LIKAAHINSYSVLDERVLKYPASAPFHGFGRVSGIPFWISAFCCIDGAGLWEPNRDY